jgi:hypothetical protein
MPLYSVFLHGDAFYNTHVSVRGIMAVSKAPAGRVEKLGIFLFGTLSSIAPAHHMDIE